jgi:hypothetical protein
MSSPVATVERVRFGTGELLQVGLLDAAQAEATVSRVDNVAPDLRVVGDNGLTTIGRPLYRQRGRLAEYTHHARADNRRLYRHFRAVHEAVASFVERHYGAPVVFAEDLAVPGFHVFAFDAHGDYAGGAWHVDALPAQVPFLAARPAEITAILNFTLPLQVPSGGTGMDLWDGGPGADGQGRGTPVHAAYTPGVMLVTEHDYWHRIGASRCRHAHERRITLQGHGVLWRGQWLLFW